MLAAPLVAAAAARLGAVLSAVRVVVPVLAAAGCGASAAATAASRAHPDVTVLRAAIAGKKEMIAAYNAVRAAHPSLAPRIDPLLRDNTAHLAELQRRLIQPHAAAQPKATRRPGVPQVPAGRAAALAALRSAERDAAAAHIQQLRGVAPSLAQLLASVAACEATHVVALSRTGLTR